MEARLVHAALFAASLISLGAGYRTRNFIVEGPTPEVAEQVGLAAERYRRDLAIEWLGREMPNWSQPCPITVEVGERLGAGGATSFVFDRGEVFGWRMTIQGALVRVLDSVLPHEVTHTVFATHFRRPLPRWADEGACSTVEHKSERSKQQKMLISFLKNRRGIAFQEMFAMTEYPRDVLPLYAQGHSLATFLISQGGKQKYLEYVADGLESKAWGKSTARHYGYANLGELQEAWLDWVRGGSRLPLANDNGELLAANVSSGNVPARDLPAASPRGERPRPDLVYHEPGGRVFHESEGPVDHEPDGRVFHESEGPVDHEPRGQVHSEPRSDALAGALVPVRRPGRYTPGSTRSGGLLAARLNGPIRNQVTRPQAAQSVEQRVLEWDQSKPAPPAVAEKQVPPSRSRIRSTDRQGDPPSIYDRISDSRRRAG